MSRARYIVPALQVLTFCLIKTDMGQVEAKDKLSLFCSFAWGWFIQNNPYMLILSVLVSLFRK